MYKIRYLPLAKKDLTEIITYISDHLKSPKAAMDLLNSFDESISKLGQFPYMRKVSIWLPPTRWVPCSKAPALNSKKALN